MLKRFVCSLLLTFSVLTAGAQSNVFLDRAYWTKMPAVDQVKADEAKGNDPTALTPYAFDATVYAIIEKAPQPTILYLLSKAGNGVNKITHDGRTYIFWAAYAGNTELMEWLQKNGAKTDLLDEHGYTILNFAASTGQQNTRVFDLCLAYGADLKKDLNHDGANALLLAGGGAKDLTTIDYFAAKGIDLKSKDASGYTLPDYVARNGNTAVLEELLKRGLSFSENAIIMAAQGTRSNTNTLATYRFLESKGVNLAAVSKEGNNALHYIVRKPGQREVIQYFMAKKAKAGQVNKEGETVLMQAASANKEASVLSLLVIQSGNLNAENKARRTALSLAVQYNTPEIVALLLEKGADATTLDAEGNNLAYYLINSYNAKDRESFQAKAALLEAKGISVKTVQKNGNSAYHLAVAKNDLGLLKWLEPDAKQLNQKNSEGLTALHKAALSAQDDALLKYLVQRGASTADKTSMGETAYDLALENELLKKAKINIDFLKS